VGDVNIRLDRPTDPFTRGFNDVLEAHGLQTCVTGSTHDLGGLLDVVVTRNDLTRPSVAVLHVRLSDHRLLLWQASLARSCPAYKSVTSRPWGRLDTVAFRAALSSSALCSAGQWSELSIHDLAQLYNSEVIIILDTLVPLRTVSCRRRPSDPWFDEECRIEKRCVRRLERKARAATSGELQMFLQSSPLGQPVAAPIVPYSRKNTNHSGVQKYQLSVRHHVNYGIPLMY